MLWIIQTTLFSILFILIIHYLYDFLKLNLTSPLVKDLARTQSNKYDEIYNIIKSSNERIPNAPKTIAQQESESSFLTTANTPSSYEDLYTIQRPVDSSFLKPDTNLDMKSELKQFLKSQMNE